MTASRVGELLASKYRLDKRLGVGGTGEVYRAENIAIGRSVAIKILREESMSNAQVVQRFLREAKAANRVRHPNVVDVLDVGEDAAGIPFIVQELLHGQDLAQHIDECRGRLSQRSAVAIMMPVIDAVGAAHRAGVVHRDIKPENVFLSQPDATSAAGAAAIVPKVLDFGISRMTEDAQEQRLTGSYMAMGTPLYMSPEAIKGLRYTDERSDVWSLGVLLYELLSGTTPFRADNQMALFVAISTEPPRPVPRGTIPEGLLVIIGRCLEKDPSKRFSDAGELALAVRAFVERAGGLDALSSSPRGTSQRTDDARPTPPAGQPRPDRSSAPELTPTAHTLPGDHARGSSPDVTRDLAPIRPAEPAPVTQPKLVFKTKLGAQSIVPPPERPLPPEPRARRSSGWLVMSAAVALILCVPILVFPLLPIARGGLESLAVGSRAVIDGLCVVACALAYLCWRWATGEQSKHVAWDMVAAAFVWVGFAFSLLCLGHPQLVASISAGAAQFGATRLLPWSLVLAALFMGLYGTRAGLASLRRGLLDFTDSLVLGASLALLVFGARATLDANKPVARELTVGEVTERSDEDTLAPRRTERATVAPPTSPDRPAPRSRR